MVGDRVGPEGSPAVVASRPDSIAPHHTGTIEVECPPLEVQPLPRTDQFTHTFTTGDPNPAPIATVTVTIEWPDSFIVVSNCAACGGCVGYLPDSTGICKKLRRRQASPHGVTPSSARNREVI